MTVTKVAEFRVRPDGVSAAREAIATFVRTVAESEPGTLRYEAFERGDRRFLNLMEFADSDAERHHQETAYVRTFVAALYPLCEEEPVFTEMEPIGK